MIKTSSQIKSIIQAFKSLSTRLLLLTAIWVGFIVSAISYTMVLNEQLEVGSNAIQKVSELRYEVFRLGMMIKPGFDQDQFWKSVSHFENEMSKIQEPDPWRPVLIQDQTSFSTCNDTLFQSWYTDILPRLEEAALSPDKVPMTEIAQYAEKLTELVHYIEKSRDFWRWKMRYLQLLLIVLAFASLFAIMWLLLSWVITPLRDLNEGIAKLAQGNLSARVKVAQDDEIGRIAEGFNQMAGRLQDFYNTLEKRVEEKTIDIEEKNRSLAQLYEMLKFFTKPNTIEAVSEGFVERILRYFSAHGASVHLLDTKNNQVMMIAAQGISGQMLEDLAVVPLEESFCEAVMSSHYYVRQTSQNPQNDIKTTYGFLIRDAGKTVGVVALYFEDDHVIEEVDVELIASFCVHLGVAINNRNLIEQERQLAVMQERGYFAQGLHDSIAQGLSFLNLQVQVLSDAMKNEDKTLTDETLSSIREGVQESYEDVRELLLNFREKTHKEGFVDNVRTVIKRFETQARIPVKLKIQGAGVQLTERQITQVVFIIQEALSNVRKHAQASMVEVNIYNSEDFVVTVVDDGLGLDEELMKKRKTRHVGLSIMGERASRIQARVTIEPASPLGGTKVRLVIPADNR